MCFRDCKCEDDGVEDGWFYIGTGYGAFYGMRMRFRRKDMPGFDERKVARFLCF